TIKVRFDYKVVCMFSKCTIPLFTLIQHFLRSLALGNIFDCPFVIQNISPLTSNCPCIFPNKDYSAITPYPLRLQTPDLILPLKEFSELSTQVWSCKPLLL